MDMKHAPRPVHRFAVLGVAVALALGVASGTAVIVPAPDAQAEDAPGAVAFFDAKFAVMAKGCADKLFETAADAKAQQFYQFACETAQQVIDDWDPDHAGARGLLGFVKPPKSAEWVADPKANVQRQNTKNTKEAQASFDARVKKWRESRAKVDQFVAAKYAQIGAECAAKGFAEQAKKAAERAVALDTDCEPARKMLGYARIGKLWVTKEKAAAINKASEGKPVEGKSKLEEVLGVSLNKIASAHFRVEDEGTKDALVDAVKGLETMYAYYMADIGRDPTEDVFGGRVLELCVVSKKDTWDKWVDGVSGFKDKKWLKESNTYRNLADLRTGTLRVETAEHVDTRDPLLHHAAHILNYTIWRAQKTAWIDEGLAYYYTVKIQETTRTHCVAKEDGGYAQGPAVGGEKDWTVSERWKPYLKNIVVKKADVELRKILNTPLATLDLPSSVKAWGVISWMMDAKHDTFIAFLKEMKDWKETGKEKQEEILQRLFGMSVEAIDAEWRAYAVRAY